MKKINRKKGFFSISAVAKMFSVHQQTIRLYEKQGLITPHRSTGNTRLFSEEDVDRLEEVIYLTHNLGINLAGVEMILKLKKQINKLQKEMNKAFESTQKELDEQANASKQRVQSSGTRLLKIQREKHTDAQLLEDVTPATKPYRDPGSENGLPEDPIEIDMHMDQWEVDYED